MTAATTVRTPADLLPAFAQPGGCRAARRKVDMCEQCVLMERGPCESPTARCGVLEVGLPYAMVWAVYIRPRAEGQSVWVSTFSWLALIRHREYRQALSGRRGPSRQRRNRDHVAAVSPGPVGARGGDHVAGCR